MLEHVALVNRVNRQAVRSVISALSTGAWTTRPIEDAESRHRDAASKNETSKDLLTLVLHSDDLLRTTGRSLFRPHVKGIATLMSMLTKIYVIVLIKEMVQHCLQNLGSGLNLPAFCLSDFGVASFFRC